MTIQSLSFSVAVSAKTQVVELAKCLRSSFALISSIFCQTGDGELCQILRVCTRMYILCECLSGAEVRV